MSVNPDRFSFGAELEFGDIDQDLFDQLPPGSGIDRSDPSMVNSNGIAVDPKGILWRFGGEVQTPPTATIKDQVKVFIAIKNVFPKIDVNYRSNLHVHVRVPGLKNNLKNLKKLQVYVTEHLREALLLLEHIPEPMRQEYSDEETYQGARKRYRRRRRSHQTMLTRNRVKGQLRARSTEEFFRLEVPVSKEGKPLWYAQPRAAVNLRQMLQTDTIEFRHFPGTLDEQEFSSALTWCREFLIGALNTGEPAQDIFHRLKKLRFPKFEPYNHFLEKRYLLTCHDGSVKKADIRQNIERILRDEL